MTYCQSITQILKEQDKSSNYLGQMYPAELEIKDTTESYTTASYLDLLLSIRRDGQLRTSLYDKRDDLNFHITNVPFLSSNIPSSPAFGVFISQVIWYARARSSYECFIWMVARISSKLLGQGYVRERLKSSLMKVYGRYWDLIKHYEIFLSQMLHDILGHDHIQWRPQLIRHYTNLWTYYRTGPYYLFWPYYQTSRGFHRTLQWVRLANRGRLLLQTPGPVPFWTCICSTFETFLFWTCHVYRPFEFRTSLRNLYFALWPLRLMWLLDWCLYIFFKWVSFEYTAVAGSGDVSP